MDTMTDQLTICHIISGFNRFLSPFSAVINSAPLSRFRVSAYTVTKLLSAYTAAETICPAPPLCSEFGAGFASVETLDARASTL